MISLGFDAKRAFDNRTGLGNYSRTLLTSLAVHQPERFGLTLYAPKPPRFAEAEAWAAALGQHPQVRTVVPASGGALWRTFQMGPQAAADSIRIFHGLSAELPRRLPRRVKAVVTVHDLIFWRFPHLFPALDRFFYRQKLVHACQRADAVVCISDATRDELLALVPGGAVEGAALARKTSVIYQSAEARTPPRAVAEPTGSGPARLLYVGALTERKNVATVVRALALLPDVDFQFDIIGAGAETAALTALIEAQPKLQNRVRLRGHVSDAELATALADATLLVYPSTAEGFGIPILEALLAGIPVVAADASSLPEAGGDAAYYCPPTDVEAWAATLRHLLTDPAERTAMRARGYRFAEQFAPEKIAAEWGRLYEGLINN
jgi:glycosyltransferase involved in cell wall biosynthesis